MSRFACWMGLAAVAVALEARAADPWQHVTKPLLPNDEIQMIKVGAEKGVVWIGTPGGLSRIEGGVIRLLKETKDLKVWDVTQRPEGGIWIGHGGGALLVDSNRTAKALNGYSVSSIQRVGSKLWAIAKDESKGDRNILMEANGEEWAPVPSLKERRVLDLVQDAKGVFWLVLDGDGVVEIDPGQGMKEFPQHLPRMNVTSVLADSQGRTWCGLMSGGVMVRQNNEWKRQLDRENSAVLSLAEDGTGRVWAATSGNGVWTFDGKNWTGMLQEEGPVNLMKVTSDKRVWISTQRHGGLRYWNGTEWVDSLEISLPLQCLVELPKGALMAGGVLDGLYILGDYSIKGEVSSDGKRKD